MIKNPMTRDRESIVISQGDAVALENRDWHYRLIINQPMDEGLPT